jgi:hypothetical protein
MVILVDAPPCIAAVFTGFAEKDRRYDDGAHNDAEHLGFTEMFEPV